MLWQIVHYYEDNGYFDRLGEWNRRASAAEWGGCEYTIDPDTLCILPRDEGDPEILDWSVTVAAQPPGAAETALRAAAERMWWVYPDGSEPDPEDKTEEAAEDHEYSPNFIGLVADAEGAVQIWMDYKGAIWPLMGRAHLRIVVEELRAAGAVSARVGRWRINGVRTLIRDY